MVDALEAPQRTGSLVEVMRRHPVAAFFVLACAGSWLAALPYVLATWQVIPPSPLGQLFVLKQWMGPALAAFVMSGVLGGRPAVGALRSRQWQVRAGWRDYLASLAGPPLLVLLAMLAVFGVPSLTPESTVRGLVSYPVLFLVVFLGVGLPEEIGWRGFALPRMQTRLGPVRASLLLGAGWAAWHLPYFLTPDHGGGPGADWGQVAATLAAYLPMVTVLAIPFTWLYNRTGGSIFLVALMHSGIDTPQLAWVPLLLPKSALSAPTTELKADLALLVVAAIVAAVALAVTRGRLGHRPDGDHTT